MAKRQEWSLAPGHKHLSGPLLSDDRSPLVDVFILGAPVLGRSVLPHERLGGARTIRGWGRDERVDAGGGMKKQLAFTACWLCLIVPYVIALRSPAIAHYGDDGIYIVTAKAL